MLWMSKIGKLGGLLVIICIWIRSNVTLLWIEKLIRDLLVNGVDMLYNMICVHRKY